MGAEALVLGLLSAVRGVPLAVVYALLHTDRPRTLLAAHVHNLLRFVLPAAALALVVLRPERTLDVVRGVTGWARRHERALVTSFVGAVGVYLVAKALVGLLA